MSCEASRTPTFYFGDLQNMMSEKELVAPKTCKLSNGEETSGRIKNERV